MLGVKGPVVAVAEDGRHVGNDADGIVFQNVWVKG